MKKKFLSLMMAAAVVATTSVSAFAAGNDVEILGSEEKEVNVKVTGDVQDNGGHVLPGTISVTVPTALGFTVTSSGDVTSAPIRITSNSTEKVQVTAYTFTDTTDNQGITVVNESEFSSSVNAPNNRYVSLRLQGTGGSVDLKSTKNKTGIYKLNDGSEYALNDNPVLGTVTQGSSVELQLTGKALKENSNAGDYQAPTTAVRDTFNLVLKIRRERN